jgi:hypothetical protein
MTDQLDQVIAQGGFASRQMKLHHAQFGSLGKDPVPLRSGKLFA